MVSFLGRYCCLGRTDFKQFLLLVTNVACLGKRCPYVKELTFNSFYFGEGVVALKELILTVSTLVEGVVVLKELIFNSFYFGGGCGGLERTDFLTVSTLGGCGGLERTDFYSFYFGWVWWS